MKWLILIIALCITAVRAEAQAAIMILTNGPTIVIITNIFPVTVVNGNGVDDKSLKPFQSNIIDPSQGQRLGVIVIQPTSFVVAPFPTNYFQCSLYYRNPNGFKMDFTGYVPIKWMNGPPPTTNADGCILFENVFGQLRATQ